MGEYKTLTQDIFAGVIISIFFAIFAVTDAMLVFGVNLQSLLPQGIIIALISTICVTSILTFFNKKTLSFGCAQDTSIVLFLVIFMIISKNMNATSPSEMLSTFIAILSIGALSTGVGMFLLGYFNIGNSIRYIPYPIIAGFLSGTGWMLIAGAYNTILPSVSLHQMNQLVQSQYISLWLPALSFTFALFILQHYFKRPLLPQLLFFVALILFYSVLKVQHISIDSAYKMGLLLGPFQTTDVSSFYQQFHWAAIRWDQIQHIIGYLITLVLLSPIGLLLNVSALELEVDENLNVDRELMGGGLGNILAGALGAGLVGYQLISMSVLADRLGAKSRLTTYLSLAILIIILFLGIKHLGLIPKFLPVGILFYLGFELLQKWLLKTYHFFNLLEYLLIILIFLTIIIYGFVIGLVLGIIAALVIFVYKYSHIEVIKFESDGTVRHSNVERNDQTRTLLSEHGQGLLILELQGYLFFGNAHNVLKYIQNKKDTCKNTINCLILDFKHVYGMDSSSELSFTKLLHLCKNDHIMLIFSSMESNIKKILHPYLTNDIQIAKKNMKALAAIDLDHALEKYESYFLEQHHYLEKSYFSFYNNLKEANFSDKDIEQIKSYFEKIDLPEQHIIFSKNDVSNNMIFIERGEVEIFVQDKQENIIRLRRMGPGTILGEMGLYLSSPRTANVITTTPCTLLRCSKESLTKMEKQAPHIAALLHRFIAQAMMKRLSFANNLIEMVFSR